MNMLARRIKASLDGFFNPAGTHGTRMPSMGEKPKSIEDLVKPLERGRMVAASRRLVANFGPAKAAIQDKAMYAVGRAWLPFYTGEDQRWGDAMAEKLVTEWYPICDYNGRYDFQTGLYLDSVSIDRDGEAFVLLTEHESGYPALQRIPSYQVGSRFRHPTTEGQTKEHEGIITTLEGRLIKYRLLGEGAEQDVIVPSYAMMQLFEPEWVEQSRGWPVFSHGINQLSSALTVNGYEELASLAASAISLIEHNEIGGPDPNDPTALLSGGVTTDGVKTPTTETLGGGLYRYFKSGTNSKLEILKPDRPGDAWESFQDRLMRFILTGVWPYELCWKSSELVTPAVRLKIGQAMRIVEDRQALLRPLARRAVQYTISKWRDSKRIGPLPNDWYKWDFTMPTKLSIDHGRDARVEREAYEAGLMTMHDILTPHSITVKQHYQTLAAERELKRQYLGDS